MASRRYESCTRCGEIMKPGESSRLVKGGVYEPKQENTCASCFYKPPLEMGVVPDELAVPIGQIYCSSCYSRKPGTLLRTVQEYISEGLTNEEAMTEAGINRMCCRRTILSYHIIPPGYLHNPSSEVKDEEPWKKWQGNLRRVNEVEVSNLLGDPAEAKGIPKGYRGVKWLEVPRTDSKLPLYVLMISTPVKLSGREDTTKLSKEENELIERILNGGVDTVKDKQEYNPFGDW